MNQAEQKLYQRFRRAAPRGELLFRVENSLSYGTPDCWCSRGGWIELKYRDQSRRGSTPIAPKSAFRKDQIAWFVRYKKSPLRNRAWILVQHGSQYHLVPGEHITEIWATPAQESPWVYHDLRQVWAKLDEKHSSSPPKAAA